MNTELAKKIDSIAAARHVSSNRALLDLVADGIAAYEERHKAYFDLADRFLKSTDPVETILLREELARMTFGS
jgi:hypothetical protein